ncbi:MAG: type II toxin-antitoxin system mRNA interferase toxin, RelE/StbE family [Patescibacteria group bacterium]
MEIFYTPQFLRQLKKFPVELQSEAEEKILLFQSDPKHPFLKTHKLKGRFNGCYSFSVNYSYRVVFEYYPKKSVTFLAIGDHDVYK